MIFDIKDTDLYWCTADVGWITGHSYVVYGPLSNGATVFMYEGSPDWGRAQEEEKKGRREEGKIEASKDEVILSAADRGRFWDMIARHKITILYTAPTLIRACMKWGEEYPARARPVQPAPARLGGRADQPGSVAVVSRAYRRRQMPDCGYLVADGDRRDHDFAPARPDHDAAPAAPHARSPASWPMSWTSRDSPCRTVRKGILVIRQALAVHAAHAVGQR